MKECVINLVKVEITRLKQKESEWRESLRILESQHKTQVKIRIDNLDAIEERIEELQETLEE